MFLLLLLFLSILLVIFYNFYFKRKDLPPGPMPLPLIGNILTIIRKKPGEDAFLEWKRKYGPVYTYWLGELPVVCVAEYDKIVEVFKKGGEELTGRFQFVDFTLAYRGGPFGIFFTEGHFWRAFLVVFSGLQFIPLSACLRLQLLPLAGFFLSQGGMLFIALDRLLCVLAPVWVHKNQRRHVRLLVPLMALLGALYAAYALALCIGISLAQGEKLVQCGTGDCYSGEVGNMLNRNQLIILAITVLCYPAIFGLLFYRQRNGMAQGPTMRYNQKIAKSLVAIVLVLLGSQALGALARIFGLRPSSATSATTFLLANGQVCLNYLAYGCNAPILFWLSVEYRKAFKAVFLANSNNQVHMQSTGQQLQYQQSYNRMGGNGNAVNGNTGQAGIGGR